MINDFALKYENRNDIIKTFNDYGFDAVYKEHGDNFRISEIGINVSNDCYLQFIISFNGKHDTHHIVISDDRKKCLIEMDKHKISTLIDKDISSIYSHKTKKRIYYFRYDPTRKIK